MNHDHTAAPTAQQISLISRLNRLDLRFRLALPFCLILLIVITCFWLLMRNAMQESAQRHANTLGSMLSAQTAGNVTELVLANDVLSLNVILTQLVRNDSIASASILDIDERIITSAGNEPEGELPLQLRFRAPITLEDSLAGFVALTLDPGRFNADSSRLLGYYFGLLLAGLVFCLFTALALAGHLRRPVDRVRQALDDPGNAHLPAAETDNDNELTALEHSCAAFLRRYHQQLSELYGSSTPQAPGRHPSRQQSDAVLLCIRVCHIDNLLALLNPATLSTLLDEYYSLSSRASRLHGGELQRFAGDNLLLRFPSDGQDPVVRAICCAQLFQLLVKRFNDRHRQAGSPTLDFSCAIHCGEILHIRTGTRSETPEATSALGLAVNEVQSLADYLAPGQIAISDDCLQRVAGSSPEYLQRVAADESDDEADNMPLIHYILGPTLNEHAALIERQAERIMQPEADRSQTTNEADI